MTRIKSKRGQTRTQRERKRSPFEPEIRRQPFTGTFRVGLPERVVKGWRIRVGRVVQEIRFPDEHVRKDFLTHAGTRRFMTNYFLAPKPEAFIVSSASNFIRDAERREEKVARAQRGYAQRATHSFSASPLEILLEAEKKEGRKQVMPTIRKWAEEKLSPQEQIAIDVLSTLPVHFQGKGAPAPGTITQLFVYCTIFGIEYHALPPNKRQSTKMASSRFFKQLMLKLKGWAEENKHLYSDE